MDYKIFGCKVNKYYTDIWLNSKELDGKSGIFIASCVVTDKAKRKWIRFVKSCLKKLESGEKVYISGCGAFERGKEHSNFFEVYPELEYAKNEIIILGEKPKGEMRNENGEISKGIKILKTSNLFTKKFVVVQGGCDSHCSYCLTVLKRGSHFSRDKDDILKEIQDFEKDGGKEIVITGVNLAAWGLKNTNNIESKPLFPTLLQYILDNTSIPRIRISSIGPEFINNELLKIFENKRIYPHFHLSIQAGSTNVLKDMRRHYDKDFLHDILSKIRNIKREDGIDIGIGADMIVGFPGESDKDFEDTLELIEKYKITKLHAFPFSAHTYGESVPAGKLDNQVKEDIKKERLTRLLKAGDKVREEFINSQIGKELNVLIEVKRNENFKGWTQNYIEVTQDNFEVTNGYIKRNEIIKGKLKK